MSAVDQQSTDQASVDQASSSYEQRWAHLISVTNWEKGKIIHQWREALIESGADAADYSDEAWSRRVGGVSGQHAGRLRRVFVKFQEDRDSYSGLYWSHFQAALDWHDAEMWLEGAVHSGWSVQKMREQRLEATGGKKKDMAEDEPAAEFDEDAAGGESAAPSAAEEFLADIIGPNLDEGPDFGEESSPRSDAERRTGGTEADDEMEIAAQRGEVTAPPPFEDMPELPVDMAEAVEMLKLSVLRHKSKAWRDVPLDSVLYVLNGLKQLAMSAM